MVRSPLRRVVALLLTAFTALVVWSPAHPATAQNACDGLVAPRLSLGATARVSSVYGLSLKNRPATGAAGATELALLPFGTVLNVVDGYSCNLGYLWWQVRAPDGTVGWVAEGSASDYFVEPYTDGLYLFRVRHDSPTLDRYFVTRDGQATYHDSNFVLNLAPLVPAIGWQQVEIDRFEAALATVQAECPDRLDRSPLAGLTDADAFLSTPLPAPETDFYPAPSGDRIVFVRHDHVLMPRCDTIIPERIGTSTVSILDANGAETVLFPFPQHGTIPPSEDSYTESEPSPWNVYLAEVTWSPHENYVGFVAAYRDQCGGPCYRFHIFIANLGTGQLYAVGEGRHLGWTSGGEGINFFRLSWTADGRQQPHLYTGRFDGSGLQEIWLPGGAVYVSAAQQPLGLPWNPSGTRVMVANAGMGEVMLFELDDRVFTPPVVVPDLMPQPNRLAVHLVRGETAFLWTTIRGDFVLQDARRGTWQTLTSELASTGTAPVAVRPFATGDAALIEMADGSAYVLDLDADRLTPVAFETP